MQQRKQDVENRMCNEVDRQKGICTIMTDWYMSESKHDCTGLLKSPHNSKCSLGLCCTFLCSYHLL